MKNKFTKTLCILLCLTSFVANAQFQRFLNNPVEKDEKTVITTILAIPNYRLQPTGKSVFQFWETPAGEPLTYETQNRIAPPAGEPIAWNSNAVSLSRALS